MILIIYYVDIFLFMINIIHYIITIILHIKHIVFYIFYITYSEMINCIIFILNNFYNVSVRGQVRVGVKEGEMTQ